MRYPSVKAIQTGLKLEPWEAVKIRKLLDGRIDPLSVPDTAAWAAKCYNMPSQSELKMHAVNAVLSGFGVEGNTDQSGKVNLDYINMGETYAATLVRCNAWRSCYAITSWGDAVETLERRGIRFA